MADFCKDCSIENFGEDFWDLAKLISVDEMGEPEFEAGNKLYQELCEGCGPVIVNARGERQLYEDSGNKKPDNPPAKVADLSTTKPLKGWDTEFMPEINPRETHENQSQTSTKDHYYSPLLDFS